MFSVMNYNKLLKKFVFQQILSIFRTEAEPAEASRIENFQTLNDLKTAFFTKRQVPVLYLLYLLLVPA